MWTFVETFIIIPMCGIGLMLWMFFWLISELLKSWYYRLKYRIRKFVEPIPQEPWL